jgi:cytochrome c556
MMNTKIACLGFAMAVVAGCDRSAPDARPHADPPAHPMTVPAGSAASVELDGRTPLPLTAMMANHQKQEMRDHLKVVQEITTALGKEDFDAIAVSAARITWSEKEAMMCKHMGAGAPSFVAVAENFHRTADRIVEAAKRRDRAGVATALGATLETCVGCHATYRQQIVDDHAFAKFGGGPMDHSMHGK